MQTPKAFKKKLKTIAHPLFSPVLQLKRLRLVLSCFYLLSILDVFLRCFSAAASCPPTHTTDVATSNQAWKRSVFFSAWRPALIIGPPAESVKVTSRRLWHCLFVFFRWKKLLLQFGLPKQNSCCPGFQLMETHGCDFSWNVPGVSTELCSSSLRYYFAASIGLYPRKIWYSELIRNSNFPIFPLKASVSRCYRKICWEFNTFFWVTSARTAGFEYGG